MTELNSNVNQKLNEKMHLNIRIDGQIFHVPAEISVAAALVANGLPAFSRTPDGQPCGYFCGMGTCYSCIVEIDGRSDQRACMIPVAEGMRIQTQPEGG